MEKEYVRVPVRLILLSKNELFIIAMVAGSAIGVAYALGKESQRRWYDKHIAKIHGDK